MQLTAKLGTTYILTFTNKISEQVYIFSMNHKIQVSIPTPYKCKKFVQIGHTIFMLSHYS
jgi:hypothetical protein